MAMESSLLGTIEAVHRAGLDKELWPDALGAIARLVGGECATLERIAIPDLRHSEFRGHNVPPASEISYLSDYAPLSPRIPYTIGRRRGELVYDHLFIAEDAIDRDPFYMEFLARLNLRYFVVAILERNSQEIATVSVQRSKKQGHVGREELRILSRLLPHLRLAHDVAARLRHADGRNLELASALDLLGQGVLFIDAAGAVRHINDAAQRILSRSDGLAIHHGQLQFREASAQADFALALRACSPLQEGPPSGWPPDIAVRRETAPAYVLSVRPLACGFARGTAASAIVFIHDPSLHATSQAETLSQAYKLTPAEAELAEAIQAGTAPSDYARGRSISLNTVYTHLRRLKDKTGSKRITELARKLNELRPVP
jgi:DNA-binding CsgD family transcriptional regulator/PAS domain-containing protein